LATNFSFGSLALFGVTLQIWH